MREFGVTLGRLGVVLGFVSVLVFLGAPARAQDSPEEGSSEGEGATAPDSHEAAKEPLFEDYEKRFRTKYFTLGFFLRSEFDFQDKRPDDSSNGFTVSRARMTISGEFDHGIGYLLQADWQRSPPIADALGFAHLTPQLTLDVGQFKSPFSREYLTSGADRDFVSMAVAVEQLAPARQVGMQARGWIIDDRWSYAVGVFNGNGRQSENDNDEFLYVARLEHSGQPLAFLPLGLVGEKEDNRLDIGLNLAYSNDESADIGDLITDFDGTRFLVGLDGRWKAQRFFANSEFIYSDLNVRGGPTYNPYGFYLTLGYVLSDKTHLVGRFDTFQGDDLRDDEEVFLVGYNRALRQYTRFQVNYGIPAKFLDFDEHRILLSGQLRF